LGVKKFSGERCEREAVMAQVEDHVARNLSQLPDFGVELSSMEFTSVRAFLRLSQVFVFMAGKSN
jgi:hypothetical protein